MTVTIWHNPRCSKSRATLALLRERGITPTERRYLDDAPTLDELREVAAMLDRPVIDMVRRGESLFRDLGLSPDADAQILLQALADHPRLIERPIVIANGRAAIGRPPEAVLEIL